MKIVIFGLSITSSWGNGHATLWRGLCRALSARGHEVHFFERDRPFYAGNRDFTELRQGSLHLYCDWNDVASAAAGHLSDADVGVVTSYCPDACEASKVIFDSPRACSVFYDLDTAVTLDRLQRGERVEYIPADGLRDFDLVLSYTGGAALSALQDDLGARTVYPLYGWVDPEVHHPQPARQEFESDLSYLGTYAKDRQDALERLFVEPARMRPELRFTIAGAQYPQDFPWSPNIFFVRHLPPAYHPALFASSRMTLNVTRHAMARFGFCPSGRLFEAAACRAPILSDYWDGLGEFFTPGEEILIANTTEQAVEALDLPAAELTRIASRAYERTMSEHTADARAQQFEDILSGIHETAAGVMA